MADNVSFVLMTRANYIGANAFGRDQTLVSVRALQTRSTVVPLCADGTVAFPPDGVELIDATTAFDDVQLNPTVRIPSGAAKPGPHLGVEGDEVISNTTWGLANIKVVVEVVVERRYNTASVGGQKGPGDRPLAIADYRARARTNILCDYTHSVDGWRKSGGAWVSYSRDLPGGTRSEEGLFGDRLFLHDIKCVPTEPPVGTRYNNFEDVSVGTLEIAIK